MDRLGLARTDLVGFSIGGWIAAEIATKVPERIERLVLIGPVGVKTGTPDKLDVPDVFAMPREKLDELRFHDPARHAPELATMPDEELHIVARNSETLALLTWEPYMHNPKLKHRLHRVKVPTLFVRGASDGIVSADYLARYAALVPAGAGRDHRAGRPPAAGRAACGDGGDGPAVPAGQTSGRDIRSKPMKAWHFSENAYPYLPPADEYRSIRVSLPNRNYDPKKGAALYDRYIDEWLIAEDEGVEIMLNEHHQTATCVDPAAPLVLAALARLTKKARLLILGNPVANRRQPVRVAEEMAMVDVLSKGRLECGFVRGVPYEVLPANSNPVRMNERQWEAHGPHRQRPGPATTGRSAMRAGSSITATSTSGRVPISSRIRRSGCRTTTPGGAGRVGARGYVQATFLTGFGGTPRDLRRLPQGLARGRPRPRMFRSIGWPMRRWSMSARARRRRAPAPRSCSGT